MRSIGLDLGGSTGWAYTDTCHVEHERSGTWKLSRPKEDPALRLSRFRNSLRALLTGHAGQAVVYYESAFQRGPEAARVYGEYRGILRVCCHTFEVPLVGIHSGTVKKRATGKGNADKAMMLEAARREWPILPANACGDRVDALWVLQCGLEGVGQ